MSLGSAQYIRSFIMAQLNDSIVGIGLEPTLLPDDFDLLTSGVIDSLGLVELIGAIERHLEFALEMSDLDPENLTIIGPLCEYIGTKYAESGQSRRYA